MTIAPPEKSHPLIPSNPPLKVEVLLSPCFFLIWLEAQPPTPCRKGGWGEHYVTLTETDKLRLKSQLRLLLLTAHPELLYSRVALMSMLVVTHLKHLIYNIN